MPPIFEANERLSVVRALIMIVLVYSDLLRDNASGYRNYKHLTFLASSSSLERYNTDLREVFLNKGSSSSKSGFRELGGIRGGKFPDFERNLRLSSSVCRARIPEPPTGLVNLTMINTLHIFNYRDECMLKFHRIKLCS